MVTKQNRMVASGKTTRRSVLGMVALGGISKFAGVTAGQTATTIELTGGVSGWEGVAPDAIADETNPTLQLEPGTTYQIVWQNLDGLPHNVVIENDAGDALVKSELIEEKGATQTVEFTASEEMTSYYCEVHPSGMRGPIQTGDEAPDEPERPPEQTLIPEGPTVRLETIAEGLSSPSGFETIPGESPLALAADQTGVIYRYDGTVQNEPFLDLRDQMITVGEGTWADYDERGLLGIALHPEFAENRKLYVRYSGPAQGEVSTDIGHTAIISEFIVDENLSRAMPDSERIILTEPMPGPVHNGGGLAFGPDGYLYIGFGDGSSQNGAGEGHVEDWYDGNPGGNAQNVTENRLGSILRIDVTDRSNSQPYEIPEDNPLVGKDGRDEYYAWGLRNPWKISFDSDGRLFAGDPGGRRYESVLHIEKGGNYGWNVREAGYCYDATEPDRSFDDCPDRTPDSVRGGEPLRDPILEYPHWDEQGNPIGIAAIGGHVYEADDIPALAGKYIFGDFSRSYRYPAGSLFAASQGDDGDWEMRKLVFENTDDGQLGQYLLGFSSDQDGHLYVLTNETGAPNGSSGSIYRLTSPGAASTEGDAETDVEGDAEVDAEGAAEADVEDDSNWATGRTLGAAGILTGLAGAAGYLFSERDSENHTDS